jgi:DNA-binding transcriptional regulator YdaS (Cro superfamily)
MDNLRMTFSEMLKHYGSAANAARAIGLHRQAVSRWKKGAIPLDQQVKFELATDGALRANLPPQIRSPHKNRHS